MKKFNTLFIMILMASTSFAQICPTGKTLELSEVKAGTNAPVADDLDFVAFNPANSNEAWVMGKSGGLSKLTFASEEWTAQQQSTAFAIVSTQRFKYIDFVTNNYWILSGDGAGNGQGDSGNIYLSTNQGSSWAQVGNRPPGGPIYFVKSHSQHTNWMIIGTRNGVFISNNTGSTWTKQTQINSTDGSITTRMYSVLLNETTGKVTIAARSGNIVSTTITNFTSAGSDDLMWNSELNEKTMISINGTTVEFGGADVSWIEAAGNTRWVATSNEDGGEILRSINNGAWEAVKVDSFDALVNLEARWVAVADSNTVVFGDDIGNIFYTANASATNPDWTVMQANQPSPVQNGYELGRGAAIIDNGNFKLLVVGNLKDPSSGSLMPTMNFLECKEILSTQNIFANPYKLYPNPSNGLFQIETEGIFSVKVYANNGTLVYSGDGLISGQSIDLESLNSGVYFVHITGENHSLRTEKLILVK